VRAPIADSESHPVVAVPPDAERLRRLNDLLAVVVEHNPFQRERLRALVPLERLEDLARLAFTTKDDLVADQAAIPPYGTNLTFPLERYTHLRQTSGTTGATLRVLDAPEDWAW
jgi:phenylacetate-CoA ligase